MAKEFLRGVLRQLGKITPWTVKICLWVLSPFPRLYAFVARSAGLESQCTKHTWRISNGPLAGFSLIGLLPEEIAPIAQNKVEIRCSTLLEKLPLESAVVFDVGSSYGYYALLLSRVLGDNGQVYAFEPDWQSVGRLTRNLAINEIKNVIPVPICVSDAPATLAKWQSFTSEPWYSRLADDSSEQDLQRPTVVPTTTLDEFASALGVLGKIRLVKIDVEGAELRVLKGAIDLLCNTRPLILCELHGAAIGRQVVAFLTEQGYQSNLIEYVNENRQHILAFPGDQAELYRAFVPSVGVGRNRKWFPTRRRRRGIDQSYR